MKSFEERRAEIFRRSEQRIAERKRTRKRLLFGCVPLLLCVAAMSAVLPSVMSANKSDMADSLDYSQTSRENMSITVRLEDGALYTLSNSADVSAVTEKMTVYFSVKDESLTNGDRGQNKESPLHGTQISTGKQNSCTVTITAEDGDKTVYLLIDNRLIRKETQEEYLLTEAQLAELKALLQLQP